MKQVSYEEMQDYIMKHGNFEGEIDHSHDDYTSEDFWDNSRERIIAHTKYQNSGPVEHFIEETLPEEN